MVRFSYRCKNINNNHGEKIILVVIFLIFVGAFAPTSYNIASPLGGIKEEKIVVCFDWRKISFGCYSYMERIFFLRLLALSACVAAAS